MADNVGVNPGTDVGAVDVATDEIGGVHYPVYKMSYGIDGEQTPVSETNPLPVRRVELTERTYTQQERILEATENLLTELKIMNIHLQKMTGEKVLKGDING
jgi:hypothetical protein